MQEKPNQRIMIVEDDVKLATLVREYLEGNGFEVVIESRGDDAVSSIPLENPDLLILDIMLPGRDGLTVCREIRPDFKGPILMLTARGDEMDEVIGLEIGADDYMIKPVRPRLLLARINNLLRRGPGSTPSTEPSVFESSDGPKRLELGVLRIDATQRSVDMASQPIELSTAEFDLLWLLASHAGEIMTRERIYRELRGIEYNGLDRSIDLRIARLRQKIGDDGKSPRRIKSIRGSGYLLVAKP